MRVSECGSQLVSDTDICRPQYWEIYKLKEVVGVSLLFMAVDIAGGVFSLLSLFFREDLDIAALVSGPLPGWVLHLR